MRALLKPVIARELGVVLLKPGSELMSIFNSGRVLVESQPASMTSFETGRVPDLRQPLAVDPALRPFFLHEKVIKAAGGLAGLEYWLLRHGGGACQYQLSDYHYHELTTMRHEPGAILLCGHCDNRLREQYTERLAELARQNVIDWVLDIARNALALDKSREISLAELCWWAVRAGVIEALPESVAREALRLPATKETYRESEIVPSVPATSIIADRARALPAAPAGEPTAPVIKPVVTLQVDPESPQTQMKRPKRARWDNPRFLSWVKKQPCECCGRPADDPHHLIGWGQGGMGTKAHDSLVIPLCRQHHTELHNDPVKFERKHGTQPAMIIRLLDRAFALGVLA
ncbi:DUF968 domain-containing protein [Leclercia adecarboxylata]|uniref:DUF968 domain-containing protein n=1 Tax=Leclercia adecarboxylata TaxID=83655 RepID=UPI0013DE8B50|nr:DUF968 domain-containing protein [Leclercia adecarboxylata]QIG28425.1 DUF968 domain-containing protein [Leclercia adecarboxylata]